MSSNLRLIQNVIDNRFNKLQKQYQSNFQTSNINPVNKGDNIDINGMVVAPNGGIDLVSPAPTSSVGPHAIPLTSSVHLMTGTTNGTAVALADGIEGQHLFLIYIDEGGGGHTSIVTPDNPAANYAALEFSDPGNSAHLLFITGYWYFMGGTADLL